MFAVWLCTLPIIVSCLFQAACAQAIPADLRPSDIKFDYGSDCTALLNSGAWVNETYTRCEPLPKTFASCASNNTKSWQWGPEASRCGAARLSPQEARSVLQRKWIVMTGDSISRHLFAALLRLLSDEEKEFVHGWRDYDYQLPNGIRATFLWSPYTANVTARMHKWANATERPDMVIVSTGLWHVLHENNPINYEAALVDLKHRMDPSANTQLQNLRLHFLSLTEVAPSKWAFPREKHITPQQVHKHNQAVIDSGLLSPQGPFSLIDVHRLTQGCGPECTKDGLHWNHATYDAALQIWANSLQLKYAEI